MSETAAHECEPTTVRGKYAPSSEPVADRFDGFDGVAAAIALAAIVARVLVLRATHSTNEDFYITLRYAENIARGLGFVYNAGERVLGVTTPLYTLILACAAELRIDAATVGKALNVAADGGTCYLIARLLSAQGRPKTGWLAALLYATASAPVNFSIGGMETGLVTLTGLTAIYGWVTRRPWVMLLALSALFLLRIDGLLLAGVLLAAWAGRERTLPWKPLAVAACLAVPWVVFATIYFGSPIPTSAVAKVVVYNRTRPGLLPNLGDFRHQFVGGPVQIVLFAASALGGAVAWRRYPPLRAPLIWLAAYYSAMLFSKVPAFGWYFVPPLPIYYACAALGIAAAFRRSGVQALRKARTSERLCLVALLVLSLPLFLHLRSVAHDIANAQKLEDTVRRPAGEWLAQNTRPDERVMLEPIGYIGYFSRRPILDVIGLVSPEVLRYYRPPDDPGRPEADIPLGRIVKHLRPDLLLLRASEKKELESFSVGPEMSILYYYDVVRAFPDERTGPVFSLYRKNAFRAQSWSATEPNSER